MSLKITFSNWFRRSNKGNVLLQFFNIKKDLLPFISEKQKIKVGLRTLGTDIELISEEK